MDLYLACSAATARLFTNRYSTSFGLATRLFDADIRQHIYAIYGLTRVADEIVDSYNGPDAAAMLDELEAETYRSMSRRYSSNPIVHSFQNSAQVCGITPSLLRPFFASMRNDLTAKRFTASEYQQYIHGSAEVVGLMCLKVFCRGDDNQYRRLEAGASALGAAYQKINFLRDMAADQRELGRYYFPIGNFEGFDDAIRDQVVADIDQDLTVAGPAIERLPRGARRAVRASYQYYGLLLSKLRIAPATTLKTKRLRVNNARKLTSFVMPVRRQS
jgi:phytoene synthase